MKEDSKTILFYALAVAGLVTISILFTGQIESPVVAEPDTGSATPIATKDEALINSSETNQKDCSILTQQTSIHIPDTTSQNDDHWIISGTIYAADYSTPLPDVTIEIWRVLPARPNSSRSLYPYAPGLKTDAKGHYKFRISKQSDRDLIYLFYRVRSQHSCLFALRLFVVNASSPDEVGSFNAIPLDPQEEGGAGPLLRGPIDIVLPVAPPPYRCSLDHCSRKTKQDLESTH